MLYQDEILFIAIALVDLCVMLACWKAGRQWLEMMVVLNYVFAFLFIQKIVPMFGLNVAIGTAFYAVIFLGTDIITEHYGKKAGYNLIWKTFLAILLLMIAGNAVSLFNTIDMTREKADALSLLFEATPRLTAASLFTHVVTQRFDIWFYHFIRKITKGQYLWIRNLGSTVTTQLITSLLFYSLAFYGVLPLAILIKIMLASLVIKLIIALLDTPFIYLSYIVKGKSLEDIAARPAT